MLEKKSSDVFGPASIDIKKVGINTLGAMIAGFIGTLLILILVTLLGSAIDINGNFSRGDNSMSMDLMFPFFLSLIMFVTSFIVVIISYLFMAYINPEKYKKSTIIYGQLSFFALVTYIFITPLYISARDQDFLIYILIFHSLFLFFGTSLLQELLNNYRYILIGFYGSFIALFITTFLTLSIFDSVELGKAKLFLLTLLLPIVNTLIVFFKGLFALVYYKYHKLTGYDQLGDIFYQLKIEEEEELREAEEEARIE